MIKTMTNAEIYGLFNALNEAFNNEDRYLPAKINFTIQYNRSILSQISEAIEKTRFDIIQKYGIENDDGTFDFSKENLKNANKELADLLNIQNEVSISTIKLSNLTTLEFTPKQMQALLFMIEED